MRYKTLFRVLLKLLGVWLFANGVVALVGATSQFVYFFTNSPGAPGSVLWTLFAAPGSIQVLIGLYLFFGGRWIVDKAIPGNRPYCHECGYDLTHNETERCPECGTEFRKKDTMQGPTDGH